jgi:hypothetical protein
MCSIYIPDNLIDLTPIKDVITKHSLKFTIVTTNLKLFNIRGNVTNKFLADIKQFEKLNVFVVPDTVILHNNITDFSTE